MTEGQVFTFALAKVGFHAVGIIRMPAAAWFQAAVRVAESLIRNAALHHTPVISKIEGGDDLVSLRREVWGLCRFVWNLPPDALDRHRCRATPSRIAARVDGAVKGGRSPAKRTLYCVRNANTLKGLGLVAASRGQLPSPSGGEDFPALGAGLGVGRPKGSAGGTRAPFHTKRTKPEVCSPAVKALFR